MEIATAGDHRVGKTTLAEKLQEHLPGIFFILIPIMNWKHPDKYFQKYVIQTIL